MNRIRNLLNHLPGYTGYRDLENRRDEDKAIRTAIADTIRAQVSRLNQYAASLSAARDFNSLRRVETLISATRLLADRIGNATYGYGGIFTDDAVDATALDQLRQFDLSLQRDTNGLTRAVDALIGDQPVKPEAAQALTDETNRLSGLIDARSRVIEEGKPSRDAEVLSLLSIPEKRELSPLIGLKRGATLSVLADNYVVNGTMTLETNEGVIHMVRVDENRDAPEWLMGSTIDGIPSARLVEASGGLADDAPAKPASVSIDTLSGTQGEVAAEYQFVENTPQDVRLIVTIGQEPKAFTGEEIHDDDIEVYGTI